MLLGIIFGSIGWPMLIWWLAGLPTVCPHCGEWKLGPIEKSITNTDGGGRRRKRVCRACGYEKIKDKAFIY